MGSEGESENAAPAADDEMARVRSEIDAAVGAIGKPAGEASAPAPAADEPVEEVLDEAPEADEPEADEPEGPVRDAAGRFAPKDDTKVVAGPSDAAIERAVKLGFTLEQVKQFGSEALLVATCDRIEGPKDASGKAGSPEGASGKKGSGEAEPVDPLASIPDLDPEKFEPELVKFFAATKEIARGQQKLIEDQRKELEELRGGRSKDWFATKLEGVKDLTKGEATKVAAVREKFDVLSAGYKAAGKNVPDDAIFSEAAELTLGTKRVRQEEAAAKRSGQRISRPTGRGVETKSSDPWSAVASDIDRKWFAKP